MHWSQMSNQLNIKTKFIQPEDFVAFVAGFFIPFLWKALAVFLVFKFIAIKKGMTPMELLRRLMKGRKRASRSTYPLKPTEKFSLLREASKYLSIVICFVCLPTESAKAGFQIIDEPKIEQPTPVIDKPFTQPKSGVGDKVRLEDVLELVIDKPWRTEFISKELQALRVSWLSNNQSVSEIVAQLGRNYGIETYFVESAGKLYVDWAGGYCETAIANEIKRRKQINTELLFNSEKVSIPKVLWVERDERTYLC